MFGAIKQPNGKYAIVELHQYSHSKTFHIKDKLKILGGKWNADTRHWEEIDEKDLNDIPAVKRLKVRLAAHPAVCESPHDRYVYPYQIKNNQVKELDMGDGYSWVDIEEIYGEG